MLYHTYNTALLGNSKNVFLLLTCHGTEGDGFSLHCDSQLTRICIWQRSSVPCCIYNIITRRLLHLLYYYTCVVNIQNKLHTYVQLTFRFKEKGLKKMDHQLTLNFLDTLSRA